MAATMISTILVFSFGLGLLTLHDSSEAAVTYLYYSCPNTSTFTPNSTYQHNINSLLSSFSSNASGGNRFNNLTVGQDMPDMVYGLFLCRGDDTQDICQECVRTAAKEIVHRCPHEKVALVTYDECMLRYSNKDFFSSVEKKPSLQLLNTEQVSEPERFMELLNKTMNNVTSLAANDPSGNRFATGQANFSSFQMLYTLAQCTQDLSVANCKECLQAAVSYLPHCCKGKVGGRVVFPSCNVRYELYPFYRIVLVAPSPSNPVVLRAPSQGHKRKGKISTVTIIVIVASIAVSVMLFAIGFCYLSRTRKGGPKYQAAPIESVGNEITTERSLKLHFATIETATNNFSAENKLGEGPYGEVYKGTLPNGQKIALKRLWITSSSLGAEEFESEVVLIAKLQHKNLVKLLGFCLEGEEKIIIYEFVPNKSLDYFLYDPEKQRQLNWSQRQKIIQGIAQGIHYLHEDYQCSIIHRDLKARNILLDRDMNPKVSDFGMARIFRIDQTRANAKGIVGTCGYMSPEYAINGQFSMKSDVYSFGVLILEIVTGKKNNSFHQTEEAENLLSYVWRHWRDGTPSEVLDPSLRGSYSRNEVIRCIHVGLLCVQQDPADRPTMTTIVLMLSDHSVIQPLPQKSVFIVHGRSEKNTVTKEMESDQSTSKSIPLSVDQASITEVNPR